MKTLEELEKIRKEVKKSIEVRHGNVLKNGEKHILVCGGTGCTSSKSPILIENLNKLIKEKGLKNVKVIRTGCFGLCAKGPIVVVHPDDTFYAMTKPEDAQEIIEKHIINGEIVERLLCKDIDETLVKRLDELSFYKKQKRVALKNCGYINPEDID